MSRRILPQVFDFATQNLGKRSSKMKENWKECKLGGKLEYGLKKRSPQSVTLINRRTKSAAHMFNIIQFLFFIK